MAKIEYQTFKIELVILLFGGIGAFLLSLDLGVCLNWIGGIPALLAFSFYLSFYSKKI